MTVDSPLALFTTLFGWQFYNTVWDVLLATGIGLIPFLGVLIDVLFINRENGDGVTEEPGQHFRRLETNLTVMLLVVIIGVQPAEFRATSLGPDTLSYVPYPTILEPDPVIATTIESDSTFGSTNLTAFDDNIPVPVWWYGTMAISQGINRAIIEGFPEVESIRDILRLAKIAHINDPALAAETTEFYSECFIPAKSAFLNDKTLDVDAEDLAFMGSDFYVDGAYVTLRALNKVRGFPFDPARDTDLNPELDHQAGKPTCRQWWLGEGAEGRLGLRGDLLAAAEETATGYEAGLLALPDFFLPDILPAQTAAENVVIKNLLSNTDIGFSNDSFRKLSGDEGEVIKSFVGDFINTAGTVVTSALFTLFIDIVTLGLPMLQPMILMSIFALLPFVLVASRFSFSALVGGSLVIFTVSFWPVLWYIATFMDDQLVRALFPNDGRLFEDLDAGNLKKNLLSMITGSLFLLLPAVFSAVMGIAGVRTVAAVNMVTRSISGGGAGVNRAASGAEGAGKTAGGSALTSKGQKLLPFG